MVGQQQTGTLIITQVTVLITMEEILGGTVLAGLVVCGAVETAGLTQMGHGGKVVRLIVIIIWQFT